jgi:formylglycine-generating enzyme required for sulfatase activity
VSCIKIVNGPLRVTDSRTKADDAPSKIDILENVYAFLKPKSVSIRESAMKSVDRPLRVFLCHSSNDKPAVRELYQKLRAEPWIEPWLDEEELYPGQDWNMEIEKAVEAADAIIVCLTKNSINKEGYVQRELRIVLDFADYKPEGTIYILPVRLEECEPPRRLRAWQYADYFEGQLERGLQRLLVSLKRRANSLELSVEQLAHDFKEKQSKTTLDEIKTQIDLMRFEQDEAPLLELKVLQALEPAAERNDEDKIVLPNGMEFMRVPAGKFLMGSDNGYDNEKPQHTVNIPYDYWMARFPVTNDLYNAYVKAKGIKRPVGGWEKKKDHPVVFVNWTGAMAYCQWMNNLLKGELPSGLVLRLPAEAEWEKAARGTDGREYPWGNEFDENKCNSCEGGTTSVGLYSPRGDSPYGCADMAGNVLEWTHSSEKVYPYKVDDVRKEEKAIVVACVLRGGAYNDEVQNLRCAYRDFVYPYDDWDKGGFRICLAPPLPLGEVNSPDT